MDLHGQPGCLGCGEDNPASLGLRFDPAGPDGLAGTTTPAAHLEGAPGLVHGGALMVMFDEAFPGHASGLPRTGGMLSGHIDRVGVTANLSVDCRAPAVIGRELHLRAWCDRIEGRKLFFRGDVHDAGRLVAEATGLWIHVEPEHFERARGASRV